MDQYDSSVIIMAADFSETEYSVYSPEGLIPRCLHRC